MAVVLASFVGTVKLYDLGRTGVLRGEHVFLVRNPVNAYIYDGRCVEVRLTRGRLLLGNLEASLAALLSDLLCFPFHWRRSRVRSVRGGEVDTWTPSPGQPGGFFGSSVRSLGLRGAYAFLFHWR